MIFLNNFRSDENGANAVAAENLSGLYEVYIPDEKGDYSYHGPYADGGKYPDGAIAIPVESTVGGAPVLFGANTNFANVIGSTGDKIPSPDKSWINVYERELGRHGKPVVKRCCTDGNYYYNNGALFNGCDSPIVGGHVVLGREARLAARGETVYILPICHKHNTCKKFGNLTGAGYFMNTNRGVYALPLLYRVDGERVRAAIAEAAENGKTDG